MEQRESSRSRVSIVRFYTIVYPAVPLLLGATIENGNDQDGHVVVANNRNLSAVVRFWIYTIIAQQLAGLAKVFAFMKFPAYEVDNGLRGHAFPDACAQGRDQY